MKKPSPYLGREDSFWRERHQHYGGSILAVGRTTATPIVNQEEYRLAIEQFKAMVADDFPPPRNALSALDLGFGQGHYAKACHEMGFGSYLGIDFAAPPPSWSADKFDFRHGDVATARTFGTFDLVYCLDVIFHVVDDDKFQSALRSMADSSRGPVYVTSLFRECEPAPHVKHRRMESFSAVLGPPRSVVTWRDNKIARFFPHQK